MTYRLEQGEALAGGLRRALVEELDAAATILDRLEPDGFDDAIHEVRKSLKKSRTVLRLLRGVLATRTRRGMNVRLRDAGRALAGIREAAVLVETLDGLYAPAALPAGLTGLREQLAHDYAGARTRTLADRGTHRMVAERVRSVRTETTGLATVGSGDRAVVDGFGRVHRRGRSRFAAACEDPAPAVLHEWRKRVKDLGYSLRLVAPAWPAVVDPQAAAARRLWDLLGDEHDLHELDLAVRARAGLVPNAPAAALRERMGERRRVLVEEAFALGRRVHAGSPACFAGRVEAYLGAWRDEAAAGSG